jgi:Ni/Co efflux regulator RcnB
MMAQRNQSLLRRNQMNKSLLAVATTALLLGTISSASAQSAYDNGYYNESSTRYDERYDPRYDERYDTRSDDRYDQRYDQRYDPRYDPRYDDRYGRNGDRQISRNDRDCDGISDRYDRNDSRSVNDRDCDGIDNRFDRQDGRHHNARQSYASSRYNAPRGYRYARYSYGTRLPTGYWGNSYYVDYQPYGLSRPPTGYRWNRVGNDVYMVNVRNGLIAEAVYSIFR